MLEQEFTNLINNFGIDVFLNDETESRKAIISSRSQSEMLPDFDDKNIHCNFEIIRGNIITYQNVKYLVISDVQSKRAFEYKAIIRPMTNIFNYTYWSEGTIIGYDPLGNPIYADGEEPGEVVLELPCIAYQEGNPTLNGGQIVQPETMIKVIMTDDEQSSRIEMNSQHRLLNHNYKVVDINLLQDGLRIFTMEWVTSS